MKILQVIHSLRPQAGGTTEAVKQLSVALARRGIAVDVLTLDEPGAPWLKDISQPCIALGPGRTGYGFSPRVVPWLVRHAAEYDAVVVNGLWQFGSFAVWIASRRTPLRYVVFPHGMLDPWFKRRYPLKHLKKWLYWPWAEYRVLRDAVAVLFTSEEERRDARKSFWLYRCREEVIGFGIEPPPGENAAPASLFFKAHPHLVDRRLLLFLGRMHEKKGCDLLLHAFHAFRSRAATAEFHLVMAGPHDNPYGVEMRALARKLNLDHDVTWTGMLSGAEKWSTLRAAEVFILPSHQENFGVSVVEALACGRPVLISNKVNIARDVAADGAGLVENDDASGTTRLLERWAALNNQERRGFQNAAQACFENRYQLQGVADKLATLLEVCSPAQKRLADATMPYKST